MRGRYQWFEYYDTILQVANYLVENGQITEVSELLYFYEKPWKWDDAYNEMIEKERTEEEATYKKLLAEGPKAEIF